MKGIIDAVNIDLKCFSENYYKKELGGNLNQVLQNLKHFKKKWNLGRNHYFVVPTKNDSKRGILKIAKFIKMNLMLILLGIFLLFILIIRNLNFKNTN